MQGSVEEAARQTHALLAELIRHEHAPLALAQRCSGVPAQTPLFSSLFNYRHSPAVEAPVEVDSEQAADRIEVLWSEERTNYPLTLSVDDLGRRLHGDGAGQHARGAGAGVRVHGDGGRGSREGAGGSAGNGAPRKSM